MSKEEPLMSGHPAFKVPWPREGLQEVRFHYDPTVSELACVAASQQFIPAVLGSTDHRTLAFTLKRVAAKLGFEARAVPPASEDERGALLVVLHKLGEPWP